MWVASRNLVQCLDNYSIIGVSIIRSGQPEVHALLPYLFNDRRLIFPGNAPFVVDLLFLKRHSTFFSYRFCNDRNFTKKHIRY
jgi:hypothetical protein